jgi:ABC-type dipeptide/oligopeptide/nickel transport system permease subunit
MSFGLEANAPPAAVRSEGADFVGRFVRHRSAMIGALIVTLVVLAAVFAPLLAPHPYDSTSLFESWDPQSAEHPLGADKLGRDIASRLLYGARTSLIVSFGVLAITLLVGCAVGMIAAYFGGRTDTLLMRTVDVVLAFPEIVFAILAAAILGPGMLTVIVALSLVWWPGIARLTRSLVLVLRQELFVDAAVVCGTTTLGIFRRHFLPNIVAPMIVRASVGVGFIIMAEATLSFLGLGIQEPLPSWGGMIRDGLPALRTDPMLAVSGSIVLGVTIIGFNLLGDGIRDLLDPKLEGR